MAASLHRRTQPPWAVLVSARAAGAGQEPEPEQDQAQAPGFVQKLTKSIRDFGLGKKALLEGGVGMFVFAGIGAGAPLAPASRDTSSSQSSSARKFYYKSGKPQCAT